MLLTLFAAILRIAEVESGETRRYFEPVNISALVTELAESFAPSIEDEGRTLLWSIEPGLTVEGDRELLAQAFINLIENAQRHTPAGTVIRLTLVRANDRVCVHVADNGPGVPKSDLDRVTRVVRLGGFISSAPSFLDGPKVMNGASDLIVAVFGDKGRHARTTVGVAVLPLDAAVEVEGLFEVA